MDNVEPVPAQPIIIFPAENLSFIFLFSWNMGILIIIVNKLNLATDKFYEFCNDYKKDSHISGPGSAAEG